MSRVDFFLANGRPAVFEMPDMLALVSNGADIPNSALRNVLDLIYNGIVPRYGQGQQTAAQIAAAELKADQERIKAMYRLAALCLVEPKIRIDGEPRQGEMSYRDLGWRDIVEIQGMFQVGGAFHVPTATDSGSAMGETVAPDGDDVPHETE